MNIRTIPSSIEIYFWSFVVALLSDSEVVQRLVCKLHDWIITGKMKRAIHLALITSCAGFVLGALLGLFGM